jgi:rod shape-determining protein MreD
VSIRFWVRLVVSVWAALVFRLTIGPRLAIAGVEPDLVAAIVFYLTLARGVRMGIIAGFVLGLLVDVDRPEGVGLTSLAWATMGYLTGRVSEAVEASDPIVAAAVLFVVMLAAETIRSILIAGLDPGRVGLIWIRWGVPTALYTAIAAPILTSAFRSLTGETRWFGARS